MNTQYALLGLLKGGPNYGYELKKSYDKLFANNKLILPGQIYATLARLKRDAKITALPRTEKSGGPDRIKYAITALGEEALQTWLMTAEEPAARLSPEIYVKTILAIAQDGDAAPYLDTQRRAHLQRMRELTTIRRNVPLAMKLRIDHALFHIEADLRWMELTNSRLGQLKEEV